MIEFGITLADELVAALNDPARSWQAVPPSVGVEDRRFTAVRSYNPKYSMEELETVRVTLVAGELVWERVSRSMDKMGHEIQMGYQKRVQGTDDEIKQQMDALTIRVGEVCNWLRKHPRIDTSPSAVLMKITSVPYSPDHLDESQVFTSLLSLVYQVFS